VKVFTLATEVPGSQPCHYAGARDAVTHEFRQERVARIVVGPGLIRGCHCGTRWHPALPIAPLPGSLRPRTSLDPPRLRPRLVQQVDERPPVDETAAEAKRDLAGRSAILARVILFPGLRQCVAVRKLRVPAEARRVMEWLTDPARREREWRRLVETRRDIQQWSVSHLPNGGLRLTRW
jgi:hypothetical protein